ncbi:hypothetical protein L3Q82_002936 [Scortum barcoo]|uniref:Uncharacterized protein n=1 Tax=Scortum barcoo TaxID=214431 RepID=A0ACB8VV99_9TELE|nr:hypothetical protein L3Q82_002936 [Scortum barcoo]
MYLYGRHFTLRTDHQALTALLATTGSGHKPLRLYRWSERLQAYNFTTQFTPGRDNVVADLLSRATPCSALETAQDPQEPELILMLHTPLQGAVSLQELEAASAQDPVLTQLRTFIRGGWPTKVPEDLQPFCRVKAELSCWNDVCVARGLCTVIPSALRARVLTMVHEGHLGVVKVKQRCRGLVWWPGIDRDIETIRLACPVVRPAHPRLRRCSPCRGRQHRGPTSRWTSAVNSMASLSTSAFSWWPTTSTPSGPRCCPPVLSPPGWSPTSSPPCLLARLDVCEDTCVLMFLHTTHIVN